MEFNLFGIPGETLVKLSSIGCGAVCVLGVVASGRMISKLTRSDPPAKSKLIQTFMGMCILLALISGGSAYLLAKNNAAKVDAAKQETVSTKQNAQQLLGKQEEQTLKTIEETKAALADFHKQIATLTMAKEDKDRIEKVANDHRATIDKRFSILKQNFSTAKDTFK